MASLSTSEQLKIAYFHALGKAMTEGTQNVYESLYKSSHNIKLTEIWSDVIGYAVDETAADVEASSNAAVTKITTESLTEIPGSNGQAYYFNSGGTFTRPWIGPVDIPNATTNAPSFGYNLQLFRSDGTTPIYTTDGAWSIDYYAGVIHFGVGFTPTDMGWGTPKATIYLYTGNYGASGSTSGATTLEELTDVTIITPSDGDSLTYIGGEWINLKRNPVNVSITTPEWDYFETGSTQLLSSVTWTRSSDLISSQVIYATGLTSSSYSVGSGDTSYYFNESVTGDFNIQIVANDEFGFNDSINTDELDVKFINKAYWGISGSTGLTSSDILSLNNTGWTYVNDELTRKRTFQINGLADYVYYSYPTSLGIADEFNYPEFKMNGIVNTAWELETVSFTNNEGHTENFYVYRTTYRQNGYGIDVEKL
jgi:hypothetical protein